MKKYNYTFALIALILVTFAAAVSCANDTHEHHTPRPTYTPPFTVTVSLSPDATKKLTESKETIMVAAYFYGDVISGAESKADEIGWIRFGHSKLELPNAGVVQVAPIEIDPAKLELIQDREVSVLINVFSGRRSSKLNLLRCNTFQDKVTRAASGGVKINCGWTWLETKKLEK